MKKQKQLFVFLLILISLISGSLIVLPRNHLLNASEAQVLTSIQKTDANDLQYNPISKITLTQKSISITKGKKSAVKAKVTYGKNTDLDNEPYEWKSKNPNIASINSKGIITAKKAGKTYVICSSKSGSIKVRCKITVREPYNKVTSIQLKVSHIQLGKNDIRTIEPVIKYGKQRKYANEPVSWSSTDNKIATVKNGKIKGKKNGTTYIKVKSKYTNKVARCKVTVKKTKYIAFTFDDGPGGYTDKLVNALDKYHSKATFFVLGNRVNAYKKQLKHAFDLGMEIGSHTWAHKNLILLPKSGVKSEILKARNTIRNVIGENPTVLRPPYGNSNQTVSKYAGVPMIYWSVDTEDWKHKNVKYISQYIIKHARDGEIILLHDIHQTSVNGFIKALPTLRKQGFELVTVSELYAIKGKKLKKGVMYYSPNKDR